MKKIFTYFFMAILFQLPFSFSLEAATQRLTLDNQHSYVLWYIKHLGFSTQTGKWYVDGFIDLDKDNPEKAA